MDDATAKRLMPSMRERIARTIWFGHVDYDGYPNGHMTYDELPEQERDKLLYQADMLMKWQAEFCEPARGSPE